MTVLWFDMTTLNSAVRATERGKNTVFPDKTFPLQSLSHNPTDVWRRLAQIHGQGDARGNNAGFQMLLHASRQRGPGSVSQTCTAGLLKPEI